MVDMLPPGHQLEVTKLVIQLVSIYMMHYHAPGDSSIGLFPNQSVFEDAAFSTKFLQRQVSILDAASTLRPRDQSYGTNRASSTETIPM